MRCRGNSLNQQLFNPRENAKSPVTLAFEVLYQVKKEMEVNPGKIIFIDTSPVVAEALCSGPAFRAKKGLENEKLSSIEVRVNTGKINSEVSWS